jgi:alpha-tubulin suppressor-like RCC1 family protein
MRAALVGLFALAISACGRTEIDRVSEGGGRGGTLGQAGRGGAAGGPGAGGGGAGTMGAAGAGAGGAAGMGGIGGSVAEPLRVTQLAAGDEHTCALLSDGSVRCWGKNAAGQLGYGNRDTIGDDELPSSVGPVSVTTTPGVRVTRLAAAVDRTCALLSDGTVKCWGDNPSGELGTGNRDTIGDDELPSSVGPVSVTTVPGVTAVGLAAGGSHTCALLSNGTVTCWGRGGNGELGYGIRQSVGDDELPSSVGPVDVTRAPGVTVQAVAAGRFETCALLSDRTVKCWGLNTFGELGYGNTATIGDDEPPSSVGPISVTTSPNVTPIGVVAGDYHACALLSDGSVRCWGSTLDGELGYGNKTRIGDDELPSSVGPVSITVAPGVSALTLVAGFDHNCVLLTDSTLKCWGANVFGELGYGNLNDIGDDELPSSVGPVSISATPGVTPTALAAGYGHTCVLLSDRSVRCWGRNKFGQLGLGHTDTIGDDELPSTAPAVSIF